MMKTYSDLREFMEEDHQRLDNLLQISELDGNINHQAYDEFRQGLLKHIRMEENILFPLAKTLRGGIPLPTVEQLRLDHAALAALLVATPTQKIIQAIRIILQTHNPLEEGPDGIYEQCNILTADNRKTMVKELLSTPDVPVATRIQNQKLFEAMQRALRRAGYSEHLLDESDET